MLLAWFVFYLWMGAALIVGLVNASIWLQRWGHDHQTERRRREQLRNERRQKLKLSGKQVIPARLDAIANELAAQKKQQQGQDSERASRERKTMWALIIAAVGAILSAAFLLFQLHDARDTEFQANRAWLAPTFMALNGAVENSAAVAVHLRVQDTGRQPAIGARYRFKYRTVNYIPEGPRGLEIYTAITDSNDSCAGLDPDPRSGPVVYPGDTKIWFIDEDSGPGAKERAQDVAARRKTLIVEGCVAYLTFGQRHTSTFRFFLRDVPGPSCPAPLEQGQCHWAFNSMETGNQAN